MAGPFRFNAIEEPRRESPAGAQPFVEDTWAEIKERTNTARAGLEHAATVAPMYFNSRKTSIYAGCNEIQQNIMTKIVLGL